MIASLFDSMRIRRPIASARPVPDVAAMTGPLDSVVDRNVLVLADDENLYYGARGLGYQLSLSRLRDCLRLALTAAIFTPSFRESPATRADAGTSGSAVGFPTSAQH